jgi:hypothetical protein
MTTKPTSGEQQVILELGNLLADCRKEIEKLKKENKQQKDNIFALQNIIENRDARLKKYEG